MNVPSPCTGICKLDDATGWCLGCGRTGDEIADWRSRTATARELVWTEIPDRLTRLGVAGHRLPMTTDEIRAFVMQSLQAGRGTWVMGVVGAVAEFAAPPGTKVEVAEKGDDLIAITQGGAVRMMINDDVRALKFDPSGLEAAPRVVLAVKRDRGRLPVADGLADLGEDTPLLSDSGKRLFDLCLGRKEARFCVRVGRGVAKDALDSALGQPLEDSLPRIGAALIAEIPTRVVETALGRIEVQGQIPAAASSSPAGSHTHLLPDHLATGRALPVGMELPRAYLPGAIFYPKV